MEATIARIERRNPSLNALVFTDFEGARKEAAKAEALLMSGVKAGPLHGVPCAMKDLFDFKPGWPTTYGGVRALKDNIAEWYCPFAERIERAGAILVGKTNSPVMGFRGTCDNYLFGPTKKPFRSGAERGRLLRRQRGGGCRRASAARRRDGCGRFDPHPLGLVQRLWLQGLLWPYPGGHPSERVCRRPALRLRRADHPHGRGRRAGAERACRLRPARSARPRRQGRLPRRNAPADRRHADRLQRRFRRFPGRPRIATVVEAAVRAFEQAGAQVEPVKLGIKRPQRELSDAWSRLMMPLNLGALDQVKAGGLDLLRDHRFDFPPEYLHWLEVGRTMTISDLNRDQAIRSEVYDALQAVFARYDLIVTPTVAALPVEKVRVAPLHAPIKA